MTMTETEMLSLMTALDEGTNMFGKLKPDIRARLFAVVDNPTQDTWSGAHSIMIRDDTFRTLWQAVLRYTDYDVRTRSAFGPWSAIPTSEQIMTAIRAELER